MLAINKIILLILFLVIILIVLYVLFGVGKVNIDQLVLQNELRQCCGVFRAYGCPDLSTTTIDCNSNDIAQLSKKLNMDPSTPIGRQQLESFCNCQV